MQFVGTKKVGKKLVGVIKMQAPDGTSLCTIQKIFDALMTESTAKFASVVEKQQNFEYCKNCFELQQDHANRLIAYFEKQVTDAFLE